MNDIELIKKIQIKDFNKFSDRQRLGLKHGLHPNPRYFTNLVTAQGGQWKELRTILNPTFSAMKLKTMTPIMDNSVDIMLTKIQKKASTGEEFDIFEYFQLLTTDVIAKTALGIDTDVQNNPNDEFLQAAKRIFDNYPSQFLLMFTCFPELDIIFYPIRRFLQIIEELMGNSVQLTIAKLINAAIHLRSKIPTKKNDLLQLMLDAKVSEDVIQRTSNTNLTADMEDDTPAGKMDDKSNNFGMRNVKTLSRDMIISTAIIFYEAGFETTSTTLAFIAHVLVTNPDIQEKVRQEVIQLHAEEGKFEYNTVNKLAYMQCVINEVGANSRKQIYFHVLICKLFFSDYALLPTGDDLCHANRQ